mmetsp:Transcript_46767/g.113926  ORF Transcript_46767/g.113926 Transcript_46767/m.113926 type:complete len:175 (+) Transcript_46767:294-818(+)
MPNQNVAWLNERGTWLFYMCMLCLVRYIMFVLRISNALAWTTLVVSHSVVTFWLFHVKTGSLLTWEDDGGKYDRMTYWEQIDGGLHYTSNRKFLMIVPLVLLFFAYEACSQNAFLVNLVFTFLVVIPKMPLFAKKPRHRRGQSGSYNVLFQSFADQVEEEEEVEEKTNGHVKAN